MTIAVILQSKDTGTITVAPDTPVIEVIRTLAERRIGAVPVVDGDRVQGIFSERDVIMGLRDGDVAILQRAVAEVMTTPAVTVSPDEDVLAALSLMTRRRIRHLPVIDRDTLVGVVSIGDLVKFRIDRIEADARAMVDYIRQA